jgi:hypothetical protein
VFEVDADRVVPIKVSFGVRIPNQGVEPASLTFAIGEIVQDRSSKRVGFEFEDRLTQGGWVEKEEQEKREDGMSANMHKNRIIEVGCPLQVGIRPMSK